MPKLEGLREKVKLKLPLSGGTVWLWSYLLAGEDEEIERIYFGKKKASFDIATGLPTGEFEVDMETLREARLKALELLFVDWDFTNGDGSKVEFNREAIARLPALDMKVLLDKADEIVNTSRLEETKKKSS